jgi:hypothetical protein
MSPIVKRVSDAGPWRVGRPTYSRPASETEADLFEHLPAAESIGRPLCGDRFLARIERLTGRSFKPGKRGPQPAERKDGRWKRSG